MSYQTDNLTPFEKIQEAISSIDERAYLTVFSFKRQDRHFNQYHENDYLSEYHYSIIPLRRSIVLTKRYDKGKYNFPLVFDYNPEFTECISSGSIIGIIPQPTKRLEVNICKITIVCSEIRITRDEMFFINPYILKGKDIIQCINSEVQNSCFSLSTEQIKGFIDSPFEKVEKQLLYLKTSGTDSADLRKKADELLKKEIADFKQYFGKYGMPRTKITISNLLFSEPFITNNLNKEDVEVFFERNKEKQIIDIKVEFGINNLTISYSIEGKTIVEEASSVNYYWDESINNIYSTKVTINDSHLFIKYISNLIEKNDMVIVGDEFLSVSGYYRLKIALPEDAELKAYSNHPIKKDSYLLVTLEDDIPLENRVKYISTIIGGDCVHSHKSSEIRGTKHSL